MEMHAVVEIEGHRVIPIQDGIAADLAFPERRGDPANPGVSGDVLAFLHFREIADAGTLADFRLFATKA